MSEDATCSDRAAPAFVEDCQLLTCTRFGFMTNNLFDYFADFLVLLPFVLAARAILPNQTFFRACCTLMGAILLYYFAPRFVLPIIGYWVVVWALQFLARKGEDNLNWYQSGAILATIVIIPIVPMLLWKLFPVPFQDAINEFALKILDSLFPSLAYADYLVPSVIPLGLSFFTFRAIDLLIKNYLGLLEPQRLDDVLFYGLFPPILVLGPIAEYEEVTRFKLPISRAPDPGDIAVGLFRIALGAVKIFVIAALLDAAAAHLWADGNNRVLAKWAALLVYGLFFYFNFAGYSEAAIGCARLLGIRLKENFANPYLKTTPQAFWNSWHMSLTRFAQRYVFTPFGGMRARRKYIPIFATIMTIALWHGMTVPIFIFGLFHGSVVAAHRFLQERRRLAGLPPINDSIPITWLKRALVLLFVSFSIPLLLLDTAAAFDFYLGLIGLGPLTK